jgi:hypothetical protein
MLQAHQPSNLLTQHPTKIVFEIYLIQKKQVKVREKLILFQSDGINCKYLYQSDGIITKQGLHPM